MLIADAVTFLLVILIRSLLCSAEWMLRGSQMYNVIILWFGKHACTHHAHIQLVLTRLGAQQDLPPFTYDKVVQRFECLSPETFAFM